MSDREQHEKIIPYSGHNNRGNWDNQTDFLDDLLGRGAGDPDDQPGDWQIRPLAETPVNLSEKPF